MEPVMSATTVYAVQAFDEIDGRIVQGDRIPVRSLDGAMKRAEGLNTFKAGAVAMQIFAAETGTGAEVVTVLKTFGSVPAEFTPSL
jgi:hypothetical protein